MIKTTKVGVFGDNRGLFFPLQLDSNWVQSNVSISSKWTFRGLHHQKGSSAQTKLVTVIKGSIIDFIVDLRFGSFKDIQFFRMFPGHQLKVPAGYAHGFLSLEDDTIIQYLVDNNYNPHSEISFDWKSIDIIKEIILLEIGNEANINMSDKDKNSVVLDDSHIETIDF